MAAKPKDKKLRFMEKVAVQDNGRWLWTAYVMKNGYGLFRMPDGHKLAHRISYELFNGPLLPQMDVMHSCDNPTCVNPMHLSLGTRSDNMQDAISKNRAAVKEKHWNAKLTLTQVAEIRAATGKQRDIANVYGISQATVSEIKTGRKWN